MRTEPFLETQELDITSGSRSSLLLKRAFDLLLATLILVVTSPLMLLIALLIRLDSPGSVLFKQERVGKGGKPFPFYKFRSMYHNVDPSLHKQYVSSFIRNQVGDGAHAGTGRAPFKLATDPRITRIGAFLRRSSLDELPQLFNVLKGEMSLVGPRPPLPYEVEQYEGWHMKRLEALPGITGWWQVYGRSRVSFDEMVQMDLTYIAQQSLLLDFKILLLTIPAVLSGNGAK